MDRKPIGWATTITTLFNVPKEMYDSIMNVEKSPLRNLDPMVAHMIMQILAFVWSGVFAAMIGSFMAFGISAILHILFISGVLVTYLTFRSAENNPASYDMLKKGIRYSARANGGEHE